jgi:hypothetical protein
MQNLKRSYDKACVLERESAALDPNPKDVKLTGLKQFEAKIPERFARLPTGHRPGFRTTAIVDGIIIVFVVDAAGKWMRVPDEDARTKAGVGRRQTQRWD